MKLSLPSRLLLQLLLAAGAFVMVTPFLYMLSTALTEYAYTLPYPPKLFPESPTFVNFIEAWTSNRFARYALNSLLVSGSTVAAVVVLCSLTAYGFARFDFPGKEIIFRFLLFSMMVPSVATMIPTFLVMRDLRLVDSLHGLVMLYTSGNIAYYTFMLRGFFESLPAELEEAILVDGGNRWTIYRHVALPLSKPALSTVAIMSFLGAWDEYWWALSLIKNETLRTLPIAIRLFQGMHATNYSLVFAASIIAMLPPVLFFVFGQKYFVQGLTSGSVKG